MRHLSVLKDQRMRAQHVSLPRCMNLWKPNLELRMQLLLKDNAPAVDTESAIELVEVALDLLLLQHHRVRNDGQK